MTAPAMKTLRVSLVDLEITPAGPGGTLSGEVWAKLTKQVRTTDGQVVVLAAPRRVVDSTGVVDFEVPANDAAGISSDDRGFGVTVGWDLTSRGARGSTVNTVNTGTTVLVSSADPAVTMFASQAPAVPSTPLSEEGAAAAASAASAALSASLVGAPADTAVAAIMGNSASDSRVVTDGMYSATRVAQPFLKRLKRGQEDATLLVCGDSTGNDGADWPHQFVLLLAADWLTHTVIEHGWGQTAGDTAYEAPSTLQTGTGARTIHVYNASVPGWKTTSFLAPNFDAIVKAVAPDLIITAVGINDSATTSDFANRYSAFTESLAAACPDAAIICTAQTPNTVNNSMALKAQRIEKHCAARGYGFIDAHQLFQDIPGGFAGHMLDTIHPNPAGSLLWAGLVHTYFTYLPFAAPMGRQVSTLLEPVGNLIQNGDFSAFAGATPNDWTAVNCTTSKDTADFENPAGYSVILTDAGAVSISHIWQALPAKLVAGQWVTVSARVKIAADQNYSAGNVALYDTTGTTTSLGDTVWGRDGWRWETVSRYFPVGVVTPGVRLYADSVSTADSQVARVDRVVVTLGVMPRDIPIGGGDVDMKIAAQHTADSSAFAPHLRVFNVKDYGAVGNGTTDDTAAINAVLYAARMNGGKRGGTVLIPSGNYKITAPLNLYVGVSVVGEDWAADSTYYNGSNLIADNTFTGSAMLLMNADGATVSDPTTRPDLSWHWGVIEKLFFKGNGITGPHGLNPGWNGEGSTIRNCSFRYCNSGIYLTDTQASCSIETVTMFDNAIGLNCDGIDGIVRVFGLSGDNNTNLLRVKGGRASSVTVDGMKAESYLAGSGDPVVNVVDLLGGSLTIVGGYARTSAARTQCIKVSQPAGGSTRPAITLMGFDCADLYTYLLNDVLDSHHIVPGYGLTYPLLTYNLNMGVLGAGNFGIGNGRSVTGLDWNGVPFAIISGTGSDGTTFHAGPGDVGGSLTNSAGNVTLFQWTHNTGPKMAFFGVTPAARPAAISTPTSDTVGTKAAIDAIRAALTNLGLTS